MYVDARWPLTFTSEFIHPLTVFFVTLQVVKAPYTGEIATLFSKVRESSFLYNLPIT